MFAVHALCALVSLGAAPKDKAAPAPAVADDATRAKEIFKVAQKLYKEARYADAIAKFEEAYALKPSPVLFYNIGRCHEQLGDVPKALRSYRDYLRMAPDAKDKDTVNDAIANLERRLKEKGLQQLLVFADPPGATIEVDGKVLGNSPASVELSAGNHRLVVKAEGFETADRSFVMQTARATEMTINLRPVAKAGEPVKVEPTPTPTVTTTKTDPGPPPPPPVVTAEPEPTKPPLLFVALRGNAGVPLASPDLTTFFGSALVGVQVSHALSFALGGLFVRGGGVMVRGSFVPFNATGKLKPVVSLEVPMVFGPPFSLGVAVSPGVQFDVMRWLSLGAELPITFFPVAPPGAPGFYIFGAATAAVRFL